MDKTRTVWLKMDRIKAQLRSVDCSVSIVLEEIQKIIPGIITLDVQYSTNSYGYVLFRLWDGQHFVSQTNKEWYDITFTPKELAEWIKHQRILHQKFEGIL